MNDEQARFKLGAFAIVLNEKKEVLLCHRTDKDLWNLPGGRIEYGESPWDAVRREVEEETGFNTDIVRLIGVYSKPQKDEVVFLFLCKIAGGEITKNKEASDIRYFDINNIPTNIPEKHLERIKDALEEDTNTIFKIQEDKT